MFKMRTTFLLTEEVSPETRTRREVDRPGACEANQGRLLFYWPVSSSSPFIHLMEAAGLLPMAVQVSSVSFPSLTTSSRLSMIGLPGGTDPQQQQQSERPQHDNIYTEYGYTITKYYGYKHNVSYHPYGKIKSLTLKSFIDYLLLYIIHKTAYLLLHLWIYTPPNQLKFSWRHFSASESKTGHAKTVNECTWITKMEKR